MARAPRPPELDLPVEVRLMNAAALVLAGVAALLLLTSALAWLVRQPAFAIRAIAVEGDVGRNSVATLRANALPQLSGNFLTIDLGAVRRAFEQAPWVRHAVVQRVWPDRLRVRLEEHRAAALWSSESAADRLVDTYGEVFDANTGDVDDDALPRLSGPDGSAARVLAMLGRVAAALTPLGGRVDELALSNRGSWRATLASGAAIELGRGSDDEVIARAGRFVASVPQVTGRYGRALEHADLRHADGYAVRLRGVTTTASATARPKN